MWFKNTKSKINKCGKMLTSGECRPAIFNQSLETFLVVMTGQGEDSTYLMGRGRDAAKHLTLHRMAPCTKIIQPPNDNGAKAEKCCCIEKGLQIHLLYYFL